MCSYWSGTGVGEGVEESIAAYERKRGQNLPDRLRQSSCPCVKTQLAAKPRRPLLPSVIAFHSFSFESLAFDSSLEIGRKLLSPTTSLLPPEASTQEAIVFIRS